MTTTAQTTTFASSTSAFETRPRASRGGAWPGRSSAGAAIEGLGVHVSITGRCCLEETGSVFREPVDGHHLAATDCTIPKMVARAVSDYSWGMEGYYNSGLGLDWTGKTLFSFGTIQDIFCLVSCLLASEANPVPQPGHSRQQKRRHVVAALCNPRAIKSLLALALA